jgi:hypothetical protein
MDTEKNPNSETRNLKNKCPWWHHHKKTMTKLIQLIVTDEGRAGDGSSNDSPVRIITRIFTPEGELFMERDPTADVVTPEKKKHMREWLFRRLGESQKTREIWDELCKEMNTPEN